MVRIYAAVIAVIMFCLSGTAHCFNAERESMKIIQLIKDNNIEGVYRLSETHREDAKQLRVLKSFQRDQKREEQLELYHFTHKAYFEIINSQATIRFIELNKKRLRNGKGDYVAYYDLMYDDRESAGTDYNRKIRKCVIAITIRNNLFSSLSVLTNPTPDYWEKETE